jgi:hypothetical protein
LILSRDLFILTLIIGKNAFYGLSPLVGRRSFRNAGIFDLDNNRSSTVILSVGRFAEQVIVCLQFEGVNFPGWIQKRNCGYRS